MKASVREKDRRKGIVTDVAYSSWQKAGSYDEFVGDVILGAL